jgi:hypothetical protein
MTGPPVWIVVLAALATAMGGATLTAQTAVNPTAATLAEFQKRIDGYLQMRERAVAGVPKLKETPTPADIDSREKALGEALRAARADARQGDLVGQADALLRKIVRTDYGRRSAAERQALLAEVPKVGRLIVNTRYPAGFPLATVPPLLLQELPRLPEVLEYRLLGRSLILRDVPSNLIVDLVDRALPSR